MKEKKKNEIQCCKLQRSRKLVPHFKSNSVPTIVMWTLGLAISRSLMTAIRAASEECGRWELDHRGLKKMRRKPCKYETSYNGNVVKRGGHLEHWWAARGTSTLAESRVGQGRRNQLGHCWWAGGMSPTGTEAVHALSAGFVQLCLLRTHSSPCLGFIGPGWSF